MRAIIIGATSGIGQEMARQMLDEGWPVGITARRIDRLESLAQAHPGNVEVQRMDVTDPEAAEAGPARLCRYRHPLPVLGKGCIPDRPGTQSG